MNSLHEAGEDILENQHYQHDHYGLSKALTKSIFTAAWKSLWEQKSRQGGSLLQILDDTALYLGPSLYNNLELQTTRLGAFGLFIILFIAPQANLLLFSQIMSILWTILYFWRCTIHWKPYQMDSFFAHFRHGKGWGGLHNFVFRATAGRGGARRLASGSGCDPHFSREHHFFFPTFPVGANKLADIESIERQSWWWLSDWIVCSVSGWEGWQVSEAAGGHTCVAGHHTHHTCAAASALQMWDWQTADVCHRLPKKCRAAGRSCQKSRCCSVAARHSCVCRAARDGSGNVCTPPPPPPPEPPEVTRPFNIASVATSNTGS